MLCFRHRGESGSLRSVEKHFTYTQIFSVILSSKKGLHLYCYGYYKYKSRITIRITNANINELKIRYTCKTKRMQ